MGVFAFHIIDYQLVLIRSHLMCYNSYPASLSISYYLS